MTDEFTTPDASPRDYVPRGDAEARAKVPRDQWDRYLMPHLDGTKPARNKGFTRVSTIKSGLSNQTGIKVWTGEKIVEGLGQDTQLVEDAMRAATIVDPEDRKRALRKIADRAFVVGGGKDRSGKGTEFHEITEVINRSGGGMDEMGQISDHLQPELDAYYQMLSDHDVQILPDMLERQVLCPYNMAGTFDNMVRWWNPDTEEWELCIADLKTGRDLSLGWLEILMQLWSYANAYGMWTTTDVTTAADGTITDVQGYYEPMPLELRKDKALIFHVPLDGTATLYVLDLSGVERYVAAAVEAKRANAEAKHKVRKVGTVTPAAFVAPEPNVTGEADLGFLSAVASVSRPTPGQITIDGQPPATFYPMADVGKLVAEGIMHGRIQAGTTATTEAFHQPEPNGPWAPVRPAEDEYAAKEVARRQVTSDQQAQADKAAERLAKVAAMSNPNTDGDDEANRPFAAVATAGGEHVERDPVTGRKKRTCGHCRKPGHTQKNCPENPASAKFQGDVGQTTPPPADPAAQAYSPDESGPTVLAADMADGDDAPPPPVRWSVPGQQVTAEELTAYNAAAAQAPHIDDPSPVGLPYCHLPLPHTCQWTSTHPAAPGQWVCAATGKPSRASYQNPGSNQVAMPPAAPPRPITQIVLDDIEAARTQAELLSVRQAAIESGCWVESLHNDPAMARYQALA